MTMDDPPLPMTVRQVPGPEARRREPSPGKAAETAAYMAFLDALASGDRAAVRIARVRWAAAAERSGLDPDISDLSYDLTA